MLDVGVLREGVKRKGIAISGRVSAVLASCARGVGGKKKPWWLFGSAALP